MGRSGGNGGERDPLLPVRAPVTVKVKREFQDEESLWSWSPSPVSRRKQKEKDWTGGECGKKKQEEGEETEEETIGRIGRNAMRKVTLRVIPLIALTVWVSWLDKLNIALAGPGIMKLLNLSAERYGAAALRVFLRASLYTLTRGKHAPVCPAAVSLYIYVSLYVWCQAHRRLL